MLIDMNEQLAQRQVSVARQNSEAFAPFAFDLIWAD